MSLHVFMVGDKGVGKTALVTKFVSGTPTTAANVLGRFAEKHEKQIKIDDRMWKMKIGCGHVSHSSPYGFDRLACCVLVYDVCNRKSFDNLTEHINKFVALAHPIAYVFKYVVLGNKIDIGDKRTVLEEEALRWCSYNRDALYFETSAVDGYNVDAAFEQIARCAISYIPHVRRGQLYNLQDIEQHDDLVGLFYESRERWLEFSEVYLIIDHIGVLRQYKTELPYRPTPGLFLTEKNYIDAPGIVWNDETETKLHPDDPDHDNREPVRIKFAWCSMLNDDRTMEKYVYTLRDMQVCLVHYMFRVVNE